MPLIPVDTIDDPRIAVYRGLKYQVIKRHRQWFVVEGLSLTQRLLASPVPVLSVLTEPQFADQLRPWLSDAVPVYTAPHALVEALVGYRFHRGVLACGARPPNPELDTILDHSDRPALVPICIGVQDPENVGGIIRSSAALGARAVIVGPECSDLFSRRVARTSMGNIWRLPIRQATDLKADLRRLKTEFAAEVVATVLDDQAEPLSRVIPSPRTALLFGSEGFGLNPEWIEVCDRRVTIPMRPGVDSLNVGVAAGIFLYHFAHGAWGASARLP
jgi:tRNA G18 (ribose-2'-O)-methylase SpoU